LNKNRETITRQHSQGVASSAGEKSVTKLIDVQKQNFALSFVTLANL